MEENQSHGDFKMYIDKKALKSLLNCRDIETMLKDLKDN